MTTLSFPSDEFPAYPALSIELADGWSALTGLGVPLAAAVTDPGDGFRHNLVVSVTRHGAGVTVEAAAARFITALESAPDYAEFGRAPIEVGGFPGLRIEGAFRAPDAGTVAQLIRVVVVDRGVVTDVVECTATIGGAKTEELIESVRAMQDTLLVR